MAPETLFERFEVVEELGRGGFGRVVRALDRETGQHVAVKELRKRTPDALLRFKTEFRSLADLRHPNWVRLFELFETDGRWGFSMELVPGTDLLSFVRAADDPSNNLSRVRAVFAELAQALSALHAIGLLHRDVKSENVRVTPEGRVVLLDFGLVSHLAHGEDTSEGALGTVLYMAPEQATHQPLTEAADWYAFGVLMYEALTGEPPFVGSAFDLLIAKQRQDPAPPSRRKSGVPADLDGLCLKLLDRAASQRPTGSEVLQQLGYRAEVALASKGLSGANELFVGRDAELRTLGSWLDVARRGELTMLLVEGQSGIGKSALVGRHLDTVRASVPNAIVLEGRCHAAEQVPFKMFDGVIDDLSRTLRTIPAERVEACLDHDAGLLPVMFPVLARVEPIARAARRPPLEAPHRRELYRAFVNFLERLATRFTLVLSIDDLQWGDEESLTLLDALFESQRPPRALVLGTVRPLADIDGALGTGLRALAKRPRVGRLALQGLRGEDALALSSHCLGVPTDEALAARVASDAGGHPLFIAELARQLTEGSRARLLNLDDALRDRAALLPTLSRNVLELLAVSGAPTNLRVLGAALGARGEDVAHAEAGLRMVRLARTVQRGALTCYHDRVREALIAGLAPDRIAHLHRQLAEALTAEHDPDAAEIARHFHRGGAPERAAPWLKLAAQRADRAAAFERAAEHYRTLLSLPEHAFPRDQHHEVKLALASALASAGRCADSARVLMTALSDASPDERRELRVRAAQQLLQAGQIAEGIEASRVALEEVGLVWSKTSAGVVSRLAFERALLAVRRSSAEARRREDVTPQVHVQLDTLWRLWMPLMWADMARSMELSSRHLRLALVRGPALHVGFALYGEAIVQGVQRADPERVTELLTRAASFKKTANDSQLEAYSLFARGYVAFLQWDTKLALACLEQAQSDYELHHPGEAWLLANVRGAMLAAWYNAGRYDRVAENGALWIGDARARGDRFAQALYSVLGLGCARHLMRNEPEAAATEIREAMEPWSTGTFGGQHLGEANALSLVHMYRGGTESERYWRELWPRVRSKFLARAAFARELFAFCRADACLRSALAEDARRARLLSEARDLAESLGNESGVPRALALLLLAQIATLQGDRTTALERAKAVPLATGNLGLAIESYASLLVTYLETPNAFGEAYDAQVEHLHSLGWVEPHRAAQLFLPIAPWLQRRG